MLRKALLIHPLKIDGCEMVGKVGLQKGTLPEHFMQKESNANVLSLPSFFLRLYRLRKYDKAATK